MPNAHPRFRHYFLNGMYDSLFKAYENYQGEEAEYASLSRLAPACPCPLRKRSGTCTHGAAWAVIKPTSGRQGTVLLSNSKRLKGGTVVRAQSSWTYVRRPLASATYQNTIGSPGMLQIVSVPRRVEPQARVHRFRRAAPRMFRKSA